MPTRQEEMPLSSSPKKVVKRVPTKKKVASRATSRSSSAPSRQSRTPKVSGSRKKSGGGTSILWGTAVILLLVLGYVISHSFATADIQITLKQQRLSVEETLPAFQDTAEGQLDFDTVVFEGNVTKNVAETGSEIVSEKAKGTIVVYNAHQTNPQRLIEETRFEAVNGQIYKTGEGTTTIVPGYTIKDGEIVPGSVSVVVYASEPGEDYNQGPTDFTIPGFASSPKFDGFYARSETPLSGGFTGERPTMTSLQASEIEQELVARLRLNAEEEAGYRIPEGYMVIPSAIAVETGTPVFTKIGNDFEAKLSGEVTAMLIQEAELTEMLLANQEAFAGVDTSRLEIVNLQQLTYSIETISDNEILIGVSGDMLVRWLIPEEDVKRLVVGVKKRDFQDRLQAEGAIQTAQAEVSPSWVTTFPKKMDKITVIFQNIDR